MRFDLHVHSALSACAENTMSPLAIVQRAKTNGLSMIAIADHNSSANSRVACELGRRHGLTVVPAMEVTSREEVHVLALFEDLAGLNELQRRVDEALPPLENDDAHFGLQLVYDEQDQIVDVDERLRQIGADLGLDALCSAIHAAGGMAVPAHVFRARNSLTSQLGFINEDGMYDALGVSFRTWRQRGLTLGDRIGGFPVLANSDAHFLEDVGRSSMEINGSTASVGDLIRRIRQLADL